MSPSEAETQAVVHAFLTRLAGDREAGNERPLAEYLALWPEFGDVLRSEIATLERSEGAGSGIGDELAPAGPARAHFGPYRILGVLGSGGQGIVYAAHDPRLCRDVALKVLSPVSQLSLAARERFRREALTASRLDDPGLCTVLEAGEHEGQPYIAMRRIDGPSLASWIASRRVRPGSQSSAEQRRHVDRVLSWFETLARALHKAHLAGVVHRDLKPGNLMLEGGERLVALDFGLAAIEDAVEDRWTMTGDVIGTPAYLPPEHLRGRRAPDARTDVYGLAVTLYESLALRKPFDRATRAELYHAIEHEPVPQMRRDCPCAPPDLQAVLETALEKDPERRYASMLEFAQDLQLVRERKPVRAKPLPRWLRLVRWVQRNPAVAATAAVASTAVAALLVLLFMFLDRLEERLQHALALALANESIAASSRDETLSLLLAVESVALEENATTISALHRAAAEAKEIRASPSGGEVYVAARFLRDGSIVIAGLEGTVRVLDPDLRGPPRFEFRHRSFVRSLQVDAAGERFATGSHDGTVGVYELTSGRWRQLRHGAALDVARQFVLPECLATFEPRPLGAILTGAVDGALVWPPHGDEPIWREPDPPPAAVCHVRFAPDGRRFAVGRLDGSVRLYGWPGGSLEREVAGPAAAVRDLAFSPDGTRLAICQDHDRVRLILLESGKEIASVPGHGQAAYRAVWSGDGRYLATCGGNAARICTADGVLQATCPHDADVVSLDFAHDSRSLLTAGVGPGAWRWSLDGQLRSSYHGHTASMTMATFSAGGDRVLTAGWDGARLWRTHRGDELSHDFPVLACRMTSDGSLLAVGLGSGEIVLHDRIRRSARSFLAHSSRIWDLWFTADRRRVMSTGHDGFVKLWDVEGLAGDPLWSTKPTDEAGEPIRGGVFKAALAPDARSFAVAHSGGLSAIDLATGAERRLGLRRCLAVAYQDGGRLLAAGDEFCAVHLLALASEQWLAPLQHDAMIGDLAFAPGLDLLAVATLGGEIVLWQDRRRLGSLRHDARVTGIAFTADGKRLVSSSNDGTVAIWEVATRSRMATLVGHRGLVWTAGYCAGDSQVFSGGSDGTLRFWPATRAGLLDDARTRTWRIFTAEERAKFARLLPGR